MKIYCPQCGHANNAPTAKCANCGVGFTVEIGKGADQHFLAYLLGLILIILLIGLWLKVI